MKGEIRKFETGATRNLDEEKLDFEGFLSPLAMERFARYMHQNRKQADGSMRDADNWQRGIPIDSYMKSMWRHFFDVWKNHRGVPSDEDIETALCGLMFNVQGMLHELLKIEKSQGENQWLRDKIYETAGYVHAACCASLDEGNDPRKEDVPKLLKDMERHLGLKKEVNP